MRCSHFLPTVCLYWANSHEVHKCKTDSWVTAVIVGAVGKKGEQPRTKSYDNCNVRFSFHKICQLNLNRVFSNHDYILCCISSLITQHLALSTDCLFLKANTSSLTLLKQPLTQLQQQQENKSFQCKKQLAYYDIVGGAR